MLSLKDLYIYNLAWLKENEIYVKFEGSSEKYILDLDNIYLISAYPVYRFSGVDVYVLFNMREEDKKYFKKVGENNE